MNEKEALSILGLSGSVTSDEVKQAYRKSAQKYHPDKNPAGLEMMQIINAAYEIVKNFTGEVPVSDGDFGEAINTALNAIAGLGLTIEICGSWVWVTGDTRTHREKLKEAGYLWSAKKVSWYFRASTNKSFNRKSWSMEKIREAYGSDKAKNTGRFLTA